MRAAKREGAVVRFGLIHLQAAPWSSVVEAARRAEEWGFDDFWLADHLLHHTAPDWELLESYTSLAALATQTSRIRLGALVTSITWRNPAHLAKEAATIDHISGGRLNLGIGAGGEVLDHHSTGTPEWARRERIERLGEFVEIVDRYLRHEEVRVEGKHLRAEGRYQPPPVQQPRPPITIGGNGASLLPIVARHADCWNTFGGRDLSIEESLRVTKERCARLDELCAQTGRTVRRSFMGGFTQDRPLSSIQAFHDWVGRYADIGFSEFVVYYPVAGAPEGIHDRIAEALPAYRAR